MKFIIATFALALVSSMALACVYDSDCGPTGQCRSALCVGSATVTPPVTVIVPACTLDAQCGTSARCVNGRCLQTAECTRNLDCLSRGLYFECSSNHCVTSTHKICRNADDCKKNVLHKKCVNDRCT